MTKDPKFGGLNATTVSIGCVNGKKVTYLVLPAVIAQMVHKLTKDHKTAGSNLVNAGIVCEKYKNHNIILARSYSTVGTIMEVRMHSLLVLV